VTFLGANTPLDTLKSVADEVAADAIVLASTDRDHLVGREREIAALARDYRLIVAGRGVDALAGKVGAELFSEDPVGGAERLAASVGRG
jgi:hypothetical protein